MSLDWEYVSAEGQALVCEQAGAHECERVGLETDADEEWMELIRRRRSSMIISRLTCRMFLSHQNLKHVQFFVGESVLKVVECEHGRTGANVCERAGARVCERVGLETRRPQTGGVKVHVD